MKLRSLAWLTLGPVTGPCAALAVWGFRTGRPVFGWLGVVLAVDFWIVSPALLAWLVGSLKA